MAVSGFKVKKNNLSVNKTTRKNTKCKKKQTNVILVEQELKFAKVLAGNDKRLRDKVLKNLSKWLGYRSQSSFNFKQEDFMRLWKGLFYCMWMSDKPLIQEELAENISSLLHCFTDNDDAMLFFKCFLNTMVREWFGIDIHRLNKFFMFVRRMLRQFLVVLSKNEWCDQLIDQFGEVLLSTVLKQNNALGLTIHLSEIYLEEIAKVSEGNISPEQVSLLLKPFASYLSESTDSRTLNQISRNVFLMLLYQSDAGLEYQEKFDAWKKEGFPGGNIECMQKFDVSDSENEDTSNDLNNFNAKDPRAGHVDVVLPQICFDAKLVSNMIDSFIFGANTNVRSRKLLRSLIAQYEKFNEGTFPLGLKKIALPSEEDLKKTNVTKAAKDLVKFEQKLFSDSAKNKNKKKLKKRLDKSKIVIEDNKTKASDCSYQSIENTRKRSLISSNLNGDVSVKKTKLLKDNKWKVESLEDSCELTDLSTAPSSNGSVSDIQIENISQSDSACRTNVGEISIVKQWETPLQEGEVEYFVPSRSNVLKKANEELVKTVYTPKKEKKNGETKTLLLNPFATSSPKIKTPKEKIVKNLMPKLRSKSKLISNTSGTSEKRVKIVLKNNISQNTEDYIEQIRSSPQMPFDADRKPKKTLLKPSVAPSRINPYYKFQEEKRK